MGEVCPYISKSSAAQVCGIVYERRKDMTRRIGLFIFSVVMVLSVIAVSAFAQALPEYDSRQMTPDELEAFFDEGNTEYGGDVIGSVWDAIENPADMAFGMIYSAKESYSDATAAPYANYMADFELKSDVDASVLILGNYGSWGTIPAGVVNLEAGETVRVLKTAQELGFNWRFTYADVVLSVGEFKCVAIPLTEELLKAYHSVALEGEYDEEATLAALQANANPLGAASFEKLNGSVPLSLSINLYETEMIEDELVETGASWVVGEATKHTYYPEVPVYDAHNLTKSELDTFFAAGNKEYGGDVLGAIYNALRNPAEVAFGISYKATESYSVASGAPYADYMVDFEIASDKDVSVLLVGNYGSWGTIPAGVVNLKAGVPVKVMETAKAIGYNWSEFTYENIVGMVEEFKCAALPLTDEVLRAYHSVSGMSTAYDAKSVIAAIAATPGLNPLEAKTFDVTTEAVELSLSLAIYETEMVEDELVETGKSWSVGTTEKFMGYPTLPPYESSSLTKAQLNEFFADPNTEYGGDFVEKVYNKLDNPKETVFGMNFKATESYSVASGAPYADYIADFELTSSNDMSVLLLGNYGSYNTIPLGIANLEAGQPIRIMEAAQTLHPTWEFTYEEVVLTVKDFYCVAMPLSTPVLEAYYEVMCEMDANYLAQNPTFVEADVLAQLAANEALNAFGASSFAVSDTITDLELSIKLYENDPEGAKYDETGLSWEVGKTSNFKYVPELPAYVSTTLEKTELDNVFSTVSDNGNDTVGKIYDKIEKPEDITYGLNFKANDDVEVAESSPYADYIADFELVSDKDMSAMLFVSIKNTVALFAEGDEYTTLPLGIVNLKAGEPVRVLEIARQLYPEMNFTYSEAVSSIGDFNCVAMPLSTPVLKAYYDLKCEQDDVYLVQNPSFNEDVILAELVWDTEMNTLGATSFTASNESAQLSMDLHLYENNPEGDKYEETGNSFGVVESPDFNYEAEEKVTIMQKLLIVNNMEADGAYNRLNVCAAIDSLRYSEVGFKVTVVDMDGNYQTVSSSLSTTTVYNSMKVENAAGTQTVYTGSDLGAKYIFGSQIMLNSSVYTNANTKIIIVPYAIDLNGNEILGKEITMTDAIIKNKMPASALFRD